MIDLNHLETLHKEIRLADSRDRLLELMQEVESLMEKIEDDAPQAVQDELDDMYIRLIQWTKKPDCGPLSATHLWKKH